MALKAQALADKEKAFMSLDLLENKAVGIGDHTANDFLKDATEIKLQTNNHLQPFHSLCLHSIILQRFTERYCCLF